MVDRPNRLLQLLVLLVIGGGTFLPIQGQQLAQLKELLQTNLPDSVKENRADSLIAHIDSRNSLALAYIEMGWWYYEEKPEDFKIKCMAICDLGLSLHSAETPLDVEVRQELMYIKTTNYLWELRLYYSGIDQANRSIALNSTSYLAMRFMYRKAQIYNRLGNHYFSIELLKKLDTLLFSSEIPNQGNGSKNKLLADVFYQIMINSFHLHTRASLHEGITYGLRADSLYQLEAEYWFDQYQSSKFLGAIYTYPAVFDSLQATYFFNKALEMARHQNRKDYIIDVFISWGGLYNEHDPQRSINLMLQEQAYFDLLDDQDSYWLYYALGQDYGHLGNYKQSLHYKYKALYFRTGLAFHNIHSLNGLNLNPYQLGRLKVDLAEMGEAAMLEYERSGELAYLDSSLHFFNLMDEAMDGVQANQRVQSSQYYWRMRSTYKYGFAIRANFLAGNTERAFYFMEKNKSTVLAQQIAHGRFDATREMPLELLVLEEQLRDSLKRWEKLLSYTLPDHPELWESKKQTWRMQHEQVKDSLLTLGYGMDYNTLLVSMDEVQNQLAQDDWLLEYHVSYDDGHGIYTNNDRSYLIALTRDTALFYELEGMVQLEEQVNQLQGLLRKPFGSEEEKQAYTQLAYSIYQTLIPDPYLEKVMEKGKGVIVPDYYLSQLPFEALSRSGDSLDYLLFHSDFIYQNSATFSYRYLQQRSLNTTGGVLGVSPVSFPNDSLPQLSYSKQEVQQIASYYPTESLADHTATFDRFIQSLRNKSILHLATHADGGNGKSPWIAFHDQRVSLDKVYQLKTDASLVVLSGCNTSLGEQQLGEGIEGLTRGFLYAGAGSVMSGLWSVDDHATSEVMDSFYKELASGKVKSTALRKAKMQYLQEHTLSDASPYYWASMILVGLNDPVPARMGIWGMLWILIALIMGVWFAGWIWKKLRP